MEIGTEDLSLNFKCGEKKKEEKNSKALRRTMRLIETGAIKVKLTDNLKVKCERVRCRIMRTGAYFYDIEYFVQ